MLTYDLSPLLRTAIGFDRLARQIEAASRHEDVTNYPPYNIEKYGEDRYRITLAVAGFSENDLEIELRDNTLMVRGNIDEQGGEETYLHKGIATRDFVHKFDLADHVLVTGANLDAGLLTIDLVRELPEEKKPRQIEIKSEAPKSLLERAKKLIEPSKQDKAA